MTRSLHILADFYRCEGDQKYFTRKARVRAKALAIIRRAGFTIIASRFHKFSANPHDDGGITGVIIVSESHLTIHTWPEKHYVNLDVFFCNYSCNNTRKARAVFAEFRHLYRPRRVKLREVWRD
jgi:S-adenosylmethionine decarboxylase proenzyme